MRSFLILTICVFCTFSCKTITIEKNQNIVEIPESIELIRIPAGAYTSGESNETKFIDYDYEMMIYPVTNVQFINYLKDAFENGNIIVTSEEATAYYSGDINWAPGVYTLVNFSDPDCRIGYNPPNEWVIKWNWFSGKKEGYDNHPVIEITWFGANAYAEHYGMRLPTKEEWEKAARSNSTNKYHWGNELDSTKANYKNSGDLYEIGTTPVGYFNGFNNTSNSYSPYGIYDLCGNVWEWTYSWWRDSAGKTIKGGSWESSMVIDTYTSELFSYELLTWFEPGVGYIPSNSSREIGFRCVKDSDK